MGLRVAFEVVGWRKWEVKSEVRFDVDVNDKL
jgi:hypothetical protein